MPGLRLEVGSHWLEFVDNIVPKRAEDGRVEALTPQQNYRDANSTFVHQYGWGPFCRFSISDEVDGKTGLYAICCNDEVRYIGETEDLGKRINQGYGSIYPRNCFEGGQETNCRINALIREAAIDGASITLFFGESTDRKAVEKELIRKFNPPWNGGGDRSDPVPDEDSHEREEYRGKYSPLKQLLRSVEDERVEFTFSEIEDVLGFSLPKSAHKYNAWWSNGGQSHSYAWLDVGWRVREFDQSDRTVCFERM